MFVEKHSHPKKSSVWVLDTHPKPIPEKPQGFYSKRKLNFIGFFWGLTHTQNPNRDVFGYEFMHLKDPAQEMKSESKTDFPNN